jgi:hypothetical protein
MIRKPVGLTAPYRADDDDDIQDYKKPWVGLTMEEVQEILNDPRFQLKPMIVHAVEARLKEKNT